MIRKSGCVCNTRSRRKVYRLNNPILPKQNSYKSKLRSNSKITTIPNKYYFIQNCKCSDSKIPKITTPKNIGMRSNKKWTKKSIKLQRKMRMSLLGKKSGESRRKKKNINSSAC